MSNVYGQDKTRQDNGEFSLLSCLVSSFTNSDTFAVFKRTQALATQYPYPCYTLN